MPATCVVANTAASLAGKTLATLEDTVRFLGVTIDADPAAPPTNSAWVRRNSGPPAYYELKIKTAAGTKTVDLGTEQ